jgi:hypothetical protein
LSHEGSSFTHSSASASAFASLLSFNNAAERLLQGQRTHAV